MRLSRRDILGTVTAAGAAKAWGEASPARSETRQSSTSPPSTSLEPAVDAAVEAAISAGGCPGVAVAIGRQGRPLLFKNYGLANLETGTPVTEDSVFRIGSLTKQFAAAAALKLASQGLLDIDSPCSRYLGSLASLTPFTCRELMNHTAGLSEGEPATSLCLPDSPRSALTLAAEIAHQPKVFDFPPGSAWLYSNANYIVLGAVIEQITGQPLAEALSALIFQPLALESLRMDTVAAVVPKRVSGYSPMETGGYGNAAYIEIAESGAAGAARGAATDLVRWHHLLLSGAVLGPDRLREMVTPGRLRDGRLSGENRFREEDAVYGETQYAMGLLITQTATLGPQIQHYGYINGFSACLETYRDHDVTMAVLCNADGNPELPFRAIRRALTTTLTKPDPR